MKRVTAAGIAIFCMILAGCGGSKVLKEEVPVERIEPLAYSADGSLEVSLDLVVVRDGPGTWARNADWDEYRLRVANFRADPVTVQGIVVHDMQDTAITALDNRKKLVKASRDVAERFNDQGVVVVSGAGGAALATAGAVSAAVAVGTVAATGPLAMSGAAAGVATVGVLAAPVLITGGVVRGINNSKVNKEIAMRSTDLPIEVSKGDAAEITAFFPLTVSPTNIEIIYTEDGQSKSVFVDTRELLAGLHIGEGKPKKKRQFGQTSWAHPNRD